MQKTLVFKRTQNEWLRAKDLIGTSLNYTVCVCLCVIASKSSPFTYRCFTSRQLQQGNKYSRTMSHEWITVLPVSTQHKHINKCGTLINIYSVHYCALCLYAHMHEWTCVKCRHQWAVADKSILSLSTSSMSLSSAMIPRGAVRLALAEIVVPTGEDSLT